MSTEYSPSAITTPPNIALITTTITSVIPQVFELPDLQLDPNIDQQVQIPLPAILAQAIINLINELDGEQIARLVDPNSLVQRGQSPELRSDNGFDLVPITGNDYLNRQITLSVITQQIGDFRELQALAGFIFPDVNVSNKIRQIVYIPPRSGLWQIKNSFYFVSQPDTQPVTRSITKTNLVDICYSMDSVRRETPNRISGVVYDMKFNRQPDNRSINRDF